MLQHDKDSLTAQGVLFSMPFNMSRNNMRSRDNMLKIDAEFKALIPALSKEEFEQLEKNCIDEGIREPIIIWAGTLTIIDGHNRYEIATKHGLKYDTVAKVLNNRDDVKLWMIDNQLGRRNLPAFVRTELQLKKKGILTEQGKVNLKVAAEITNNKLYETPLTTLTKPSIIPINTRKEIATQSKVSEGTVHKVEKIIEKAPEQIKEKCRTGEISINQAYQQVRKQEKIEAIEERISEVKDNTSKSVDIYTTDRKYNIIYADPAWSYTDWENGLRNPTTHYKTMTIDDICNLPVKNIADNDCVLFLWVTYPLLQDCFKVIESWGFKYKTAGFVWVKKNKSSDSNFFGCGNWTRANSELCLIATKGKPQRLDASISQIVESPIEEHSKKPNSIRNLITDLVGKLPRIELFSRKQIDGWDCWGNEV
jgi:N6-adenosine-specific RNA methylase IME4